MQNLGTVGLAAGVVGGLLSLVNLVKSLSDWRQFKGRQKQVKRQEAVTEQVAAWRGIVDDLTEHNDWQDKKNKTLEERLSALERKLTVCEEERNEMAKRLMEITRQKRGQ